VSGGAAFAGTEARHFAPSNVGGSLWFDTRILTGYSLGGGIEAFLLNNWIFRVEYLRDHFSSEHYDWVAGSRYSNSDLTLDTVRISFVYRP
jgi:opacity protein-like surface antigen